MTIQNGRFQPDGKDEILQQMIEAAEAAFGQDFTPDEVSIIRAFYDPIAGYLASQQGDIKQVLDSAQIEHAEGQALDLLAALIGVSRRSAQAASTRLRFENDSAVTTNYSIPEGSTAQTDETEAVKFDTDYPTTLKYLDGFEDGDINEYSSNSAFSAQQNTVYDGSWALEADSSGTGNIINAGNTLENGSRIHMRAQLQANTIGGFMFAAEDANNHYRLMLDASNNDVYIEVVDGGSASVVGTKQSNTIPTGEWLHIDFRWNHNGEYDVVVNDANGNSVADFVVSETSETFTTGGIGFRSEDTNGSVFWDHIQTQWVSVDATAQDPGAETNVGSNTLTQLSDNISGVDSVTNPIPASSGRDEEDDTEFRERAIDELGKGIRATQTALINRLVGFENTQSVTVITNDTSSTDSAGRPSHSFEAVVEVDSEYYQDIAELIIDTKAAGDIDVGGYAGTQVTETVELINGQQKDITFSVPTSVQIYVDCDLEKTSEYAGNDDVRDAIIQYIGGTLTSNTDVSGDIGVGDDVIYNTVLEAVMSVKGVYDVTNLEVGKSSSPTGTSNISIADTEQATADGTDSSLDITATDK